MPFPVNLEALQSAGYVYSHWQVCPECGEGVEVWKTPGKRELAMQPMCEALRPAIRHYERCKPPNPTPEAQKPQEQAAAPRQIAMYGVNDPNRQLIAVGWYDGVLVCQFKTAKWSYVGVPEAEVIKLRNSPFAYRLFTLNIKGKFPATKLE